jgi:hypothetical protein
VSYAAPAQVATCHQIGQSVMLDNGAFSFWRLGKATDWGAYMDWAEPWLEYATTWAVIPDVIDGSEEDNDRLIAKWFQRRLPKGAPVWHMHEPLDRLRRLCHGYERVCLGSSGMYAVVGSDSWHRRMEAAMNAICGSGIPPTWLHMLRGMNLAGSHYPFASVDSTNVARNHAGNNGGRPRQDAARMAAAIDARQCPARWVFRQQLSFHQEEVTA